MQVFGPRAVAYLPKELRQGAEQPSTRQCIYLGMADRVGNGQRLIEYYTHDKGMLVLMGWVVPPGMCYPASQCAPSASGPVLHRRK